MNWKYWALLPAFLLLFNCSPEPPWVIGVGDQKLTVEHALNAFEKSTPKYRSEAVDDSTALAFCKIRFARRLYFIHEAVRRGIPKEDSIRSLIHRNNVNAMTAVHGPLYRHVVGTVKPPTDNMLKDMYDKRKYEYRLAHILVPDSKTADSLARALEAGTKFSQLVKDYSIDNSLSDEMGVWKQWFVYGSMGGNFDNLIVKILPNIPSGPVLSRYGWHIVTILKKRPRHDLPFEKVVQNLERLYMSLEKNRRWLRYQQMVPEKLGFSVSSDAAVLIEKKYKAGNGPVTPGSFRAAEVKMPVAAFKGGALLLNQFIDFYDRQSSLFLPPLDRIAYVKAAVKKACLPEMLYADALALGLDEQPGYAQNTRRYREKLLVAEVERRMYIPFQITDEEIREAYETEPDFKRYDFEEMKSWVHRYLTGLKKDREEQRQFDVLRSKYTLEVNEKGLLQLVKGMNAIVAAGQSKKKADGE